MPSFLSEEFRLRWEGPFFQPTSLAKANRELVRALLELGADVQPVACGPEQPERYPEARFDALKAALAAPAGSAALAAPAGSAALAAPAGSAAVVVRHAYPPSWEPAADGAAVVVLAPWEFGYLPRAWVEGAKQVQGVWGYSRYVRDCFVRSGIPADKTAVVPLGIAPEIFHPDGPRRELPTDRSFRFLFVGGAILRKGVDLLLAAFREAFTADDDAALIFKDAPGPYRLQSMRAAIEDAARSSAIAYCDDDLSDAEMAAFYRSANVLVLPSRGEGYGLPLAEAQACGVPVITTGYGGGLDVCSADDGWLVAPRLESIPATHARPEDHASVPFWAIPEAAALAAAMRAAYADRAATRPRGQAAARRVHAHHTWTAAARQIIRTIRDTHQFPAQRPSRLGEPPGAATENRDTHQFPAPREGTGPTYSTWAAKNGDTRGAAPRFSLVVVAQNAREHARRCVESIQSYTPLGERCELILVDNGSTDGTAADFDAVAGARVIHLPAPLPPVAACNRGLQAARSSIRVMLHSDVVVTKGWLERLADALPADGRPGLAGPRSNQAGGIQQIPITYTHLRQMQRFAFDLAREHASSLRKRMETPTLDSFCLALNEAAWAQLGPLDETFTHRFATEDLCRRALAVGASLVVAGDVFVHHEGGATYRENQVDAMAVYRRDRARFLRRHHPQRAVAMLRVENHAAHLPRVLAFLERAVDEIVALDNGSSDASAALLLASPKVVEFRRQDFEPRPSAGWATLLEMAARRAPDWLLALEGDELLEDAFVDDLPNLLHPEPEAIAAHTFPVYHFWNATHYRSEPGWMGTRCAALFRFRPDLAYGPAAEGRLPESIAGNTRHDSDLRLKHLGFTVPEARAAELEAIRRAAPPDAHTLPTPPGDPLLSAWREEGTPATPDNFRSLLLERIPANAARVLVAAADPSWWGNVLACWGKQEVVGWALPGGDASGRDLSAVHTGPLERAALPYPDGHFDAIVLAEALGGMADPRRTLRELLPLLSERGALVASAANAREASRLAGTLPSAAEPAGFILSELRALVADVGCHLARLEGVQAPPEPGGKRTQEALVAAGRIPADAVAELAVSHYVLVACPRAEAIPDLYRAHVPTLSVCLIVKDEEAVLGRCLQSVQAVADEIVVVDTGSTDRTVEIAQRYGATIFHTPWTHDFAAARNVSLAHATGEWILVMDADEVLDPASAPMLKKILTSGTVPGRLRMYYLREINYMHQGDLAQEASEHQNMRLFPNRPDVRYVGRIHEQVKYVGVDPDAGITAGSREADPPDGMVIERFTTPLILHHYGYVDKEWERKDRDARNMALLRKAVQETPDDPFCHFNLGCQIAHGSGFTEESLECFQRAIALVGEGNSAGYLPLCYILASQALLELGRAEEGLAYVGEALARYPELPDAHYAAGRIHRGRGDVAAAREAFQAAIHFGGKPHGYLGATDASAATWKPHLELGTLEMAERRWERALEHFQKALHFKPDHAGLWANRGRCHAMLGDAAHAREALERARALGIQDVGVLGELAEHLARAGRVGEAVDVLREVYGRAPSARLGVRLGSLLVQAGRDEEALAVLDAALAELPGDTAGALARAAAHLHTGRLAEARRDLEAARDAHPDDAAIWNNLAAVAEAEGRLDEARAFLRQALALCDGLVEARGSLVRLALRQGDAAEARSHLDVLAACHEKNPAVALPVGRGYAALGDGAAALRVLRTAVPFASDPLPLLRAAAEVAQGMGEHALAVALLAEAQKRAPEDGDVLLALGRALLAVNDFAAAARAFERVPVRSPAHAEARAMLEGLRVMEGRG